MVGYFHGQVTFEIRPSAEALRAVSAAFHLAKEVGSGLGTGEVLFATLWG
jgi:hypothetical protein